MSPYTLTPTANRINTIFGVAYPSLHLSISQQCQFLANTLGAKHNLRPGDRANYVSSDLDIELHEDKTLFGNRKYKIGINLTGSKGYKTALNIERDLNTIKSSSWVSRPKVWNKLFHGKMPTDTFCIDDINAGKLFDWLKEHVTLNDYQIFSRFGSDYSIGFRSPEHATLYKLTFGDNI